MEGSRFSSKGPARLLAYEEFILKIKEKKEEEVRDTLDRTIELLREAGKFEIGIIEEKFEEECLELREYGRAFRLFEEGLSDLKEKRDRSLEAVQKSQEAVDKLVDSAMDEIENAASTYRKMEDILAGIEVRAGAFAEQINVQFYGGKTDSRAEILKEQIDKRQKILGSIKEMLRSQEKEMDSVLIIDNDLASVAIISHFIDEKGFRIHVAEDIKEGLDKARTFRPSLIILSNSLASINGAGVLPGSKEFPELRTIPVLLAGPISKTEEMQDGLRRGAADFVTKPFSIEQLFKKIVHLLSLKNQSSTS
ncbi:two-component system response regulator [Acidobacteriota bacterium]